MFTDFNEILKIAGKNGLSKQRMLQNVKRSHLLKRADNIRPYGANKEYSKKTKHLQELNHRAEQSPAPTERTKNIEKNIKCLQLLE